MCAAKLKPAPRRPAAADPSPAPAPPVRASAPPAPPPPALEFRGTVPLSRLRPSPTNPRKTFDDAALAALAASMNAQGLLQPILVRPVGGKPRLGGKWWEGIDHFEVVAGERRFRAARLNGWAEVPVTAREMTDEDVLTVQLVENDQREDVRPSERAAAYAALAAAGKRAEDIAAATGLPLSAVRDLVRLARLPPWLLAAVDAGEVALTAAALVARVPDEKNRKEAAACVLLGAFDRGHLLADDVAALDAGKPHADLNAGDEVLSFRDTKELLRDYQRELKGQPWRKALDLVPGAPACEECPKRAGNAAKDDEAFREVRADTCLDVACYDAKTAAWADKVVAKAEKAGRTVLPAAEAAKLFYPHGQLRYGSGYTRASDTCYEDAAGKEARTFGELLKGHVEPVVAIGPDGKAHDLFPADAARKALKEHHGIGVARAKGGEGHKREEAEARRKQEVGRAAAGLALGAVAAKAAARAAAPALVPLLRQVARAVVDHAGADACRMVAKRRGLKYDPVNVRGVVEDLALGLDDVPELLGLMAEACAARMANYWGHPHGGNSTSAEERDFWAAFGVDKAELVKRAGAEEKERRAAKAAGKSKPRPAPAAARSTSAKKAAASPAGEGEDDDEPASAGRLLADLVELPAAAFDLLEGAGCLSVEQAWSAARQAADPELLARPPQDVLAGFLAELGGEGHLVNTAAAVLARAVLTPAGEPVAPPRARCRVCGCTDANCLGCIEKTGSPCTWVEPDLCSACAPTPRGKKTAEEQLEDLGLLIRRPAPAPQADAKPPTARVTHAQFANGPATIVAHPTHPIHDAVPQVVKGEPIAALGLTPAALSAARELASNLKGDGSPPVKVKHVEVNGRPHVVLGEAEGFDRGGPTGSRTWEVRPLWTPQQAEGRGVAALAPGDPCCGARVLIRIARGKEGSWNEHVVGAKAEQRRLIHTPTPRPKKVQP